MNFPAKTEKQLKEELLIPAGTYPFEVMSAEDKNSRAGNEMIELELRVFMPDGRSRQLKDWLMEKMAFKLFHFCAYTGLAVKYEQGTLHSEDCIGKTGYAVIEIQVDKKGEYPDRNSVKDYVRAMDMKKSDVVASRPAGEVTPSAQRQNPQPQENIDEDVPF